MREAGYPEASTEGLLLWWLGHADRAVKYSRGFTGLPGKPHATDGSIDALRHCLWLCGMSKHLAKDLGLDKAKETAKKIADAHEAAGAKYREESPASEAMDKKNNEVGLACASDSTKSCVECCRDKIRAGLLWFKLDEEFGYHKCPNANHPWFRQAVGHSRSGCWGVAAPE